jgi:hypothetical protein
MSERNDDSDAETKFDPRTATYLCEVCGVELTRNEYVPVGTSTPAARHLGLEDSAGDRNYFIVCEDCFGQAAAEIAGEPEGKNENEDECSYPLLPNGELDLQTMADDLGIAEIPPWSKIFITDGTGLVRRLIGSDVERGTVRLRDEHNSQEYNVELADLWSDWRYDSLMFRRRAFLDYGEFVVDDERRPALKLIVEAARKHATAQNPPNEHLDGAIALFTGLLEEP